MPGTLQSSFPSPAPSMPTPGPQSPQRSSTMVHVEHFSKAIPSILQSSPLPPTPPGAEEGTVVQAEVIPVGVPISPPLDIRMGVGTVLWLVMLAFDAASNVVIPARLEPPLLLGNGVDRAVREPSMIPPTEKKEMMADSRIETTLIGSVVKLNDAVVIGPAALVHDVGRLVTDRLLMELERSGPGGRVKWSSEAVMPAGFDSDGRVSEATHGKLEMVSPVDIVTGGAETAAGGVLDGTHWGIETLVLVDVVDAHGRPEALSLMLVVAVHEDNTIPVDTRVKTEMVVFVNLGVGLM